MEQYRYACNCGWVGLDTEMESIHVSDGSGLVLLKCPKCGCHEDAMAEPEVLDDEPEPDPEYEERREIVREVSRRVGGLTSEEIRDIMYDY